MTNVKIVSEKLLSIREYAGASLYAKEQLIVVSGKEQRTVKDNKTGYLYNTLCDVIRYYTRVVEERSTVPKGTYLQHRDCKRKFKKQVIKAPEGTRLHEDINRQVIYAKDLEEMLPNKVKHVIPKGVTFVNGKMVNPVKFDLEIKKY